MPDESAPTAPRPRRRRSAAERLADVAKQIAALEAEKRRLSAEETAAKRKLEDRRKFLAGHVVLTHAAQDTAFHADLFRLLDRFLTRDVDRKAFEELPPPAPPIPDNPPAP